MRKVNYNDASILEYLANRYGEEYKEKIDETRSDHRCGIGKYEMRIFGKLKKKNR